MRLCLISCQRILFFFFFLNYRAVWEDGVCSLQFMSRLLIMIGIKQDAFVMNARCDVFASMNFNVLDTSQS